MNLEWTIAFFINVEKINDNSKNSYNQFCFLPTFPLKKQDGCRLLNHFNPDIPMHVHIFYLGGIFAAMFFRKTWQLFNSVLYHFHSPRKNRNMEELIWSLRKKILSYPVAYVICLVIYSYFHFASSFKDTSWNSYTDILSIYIAFTWKKGPNNLWNVSKWYVLVCMVSFPTQVCTSEYAF